MELDQRANPEPKERLRRMIVQYGNALQRMCCVYLRDAALAEDAVQDTFLKAYRHMDAFRGESSEKTWLMHIAMNTCRDMRRNAWFRYVDRRVTLEDVHIASVPPDAESVALTTEVLRLSRKSLEVVLLHYYQGMNIKETAEALGITSSAVIGRLKRATAHLYAALEGGEGDETRNEPSKSSL